MKGNTMFIKSIIGITLASLTVSTFAAPELPFVGKRNFEMGNGMVNARTIIIKANGQVSIQRYNFGNERVVTIYKGAYKPTMTTKDGERYQIIGKFVYSLDDNNQVLQNCEKMINEEYQEAPCKAELYPD
jgi:hypothetical protein